MSQKRRDTQNKILQSPPRIISFPSFTIFHSYALFILHQPPIAGFTHYVVNLQEQQVKSEIIEFGHFSNRLLI